MITKSYVRAEIKPTNYGLYSIEITDCEGNLRIYRDLTGDLYELTRFVDRINRGNVSTIHIDEMVEDFLS